MASTSSKKPNDDVEIQEVPTEVATSLEDQTGGPSNKNSNGCPRWVLILVVVLALLLVGGGVTAIVVVVLGKSSGGAYHVNVQHVFWEDSLAVYNVRTFVESDLDVGDTKRHDAKGFGKLDVQLLEVNEEANTFKVRIKTYPSGHVGCEKTFTITHDLDSAEWSSASRKLRCPMSSGTGLSYGGVGGWPTYWWQRVYTKAHKNN
jgi:hypothetical protein